MAQHLTRSERYQSKHCNFNSEYCWTGFNSGGLRVEISATIEGSCRTVEADRMALRLALMGALAELDLSEGT